MYDTEHCAGVRIRLSTRLRSPFRAHRPLSIVDIPSVEALRNSDADSYNAVSDALLPSFIALATDTEGNAFGLHSMK